MANELQAVDYVLGAALLLPFAILLVRSYLSDSDGKRGEHEEQP